MAQKRCYDRRGFKAGAVATIWALVSFLLAPMGFFEAIACDLGTIAYGNGTAVAQGTLFLMHDAFEVHRGTSLCSDFSAVSASEVSAQVAACFPNGTVWVPPPALAAVLVHFEELQSKRTTTYYLWIAIVSNLAFMGLVVATTAAAWAAGGTAPVVFGSDLLLLHGLAHASLATLYKLVVDSTLSVINTQAGGTVAKDTPPVFATFYLGIACAKAALAVLAFLATTKVRADTLPSPRPLLFPWLRRMSQASALWAYWLLPTIFVIDCAYLLAAVLAWPLTPCKTKAAEEAAESWGGRGNELTVTVLQEGSSAPLLRAAPRR